MKVVSSVYDYLGLMSYDQLIALKPDEHLEQSWVVAQADKMKRKVGDLKFYAVPNGGFRDFQTAKRLKHEGVSAGVPDLCFPVARGRYHGLYIEMKKKYDSTLSDAQKLWIEDLRENGFMAECCKGGDVALETLKAYLALPRERRYWIWKTLSDTWQR
jgi:hypothetical protein